MQTSRHYNLMSRKFSEIRQKCRILLVDGHLDLIHI